MEKKQKVIKALKIIGTVIYALVTVFLIVMMSAVIKDSVADKEMWELGGAFALVITLAASIAYIIPIIIGIAGTVISKKIQAQKSKLYFIFMIIIPPLTAALNFLAYFVLLKN